MFCAAPKKDTSNVKPPQNTEVKPVRSKTKPLVKVKSKSKDIKEESEYLYL